MTSQGNTISTATITKNIAALVIIREFPSVPIEVVMELRGTSLSYLLETMELAGEIEPLEEVDEEEEEEEEEEELESLEPDLLFTVAAVVLAVVTFEEELEVKKEKVDKEEEEDFRLEVELEVEIVVLLLRFVSIACICCDISCFCNSGVAMNRLLATLACVLAVNWRKMYQTSNTMTTTTLTPTPANRQITFPLILFLFVSK